MWLVHECQVLLPDFIWFRIDTLLCGTNEVHFIVLVTNISLSIVSENYHLIRTLTLTMFMRIFLRSSEMEKAWLSTIVEICITCKLLLHANLLLLELIWCGKRQLHLASFDGVHSLEQILATLIVVGDIASTVELLLDYLQSLEVIWVHLCF